MLDFKLTVRLSTQIFIPTDNCPFKYIIRNAQENWEYLAVAVREDDKLRPERKMSGK